MMNWGIECTEVETKCRYVRDEYLSYHAAVCL